MTIKKSNIKIFGRIGLLVLLTTVRPAFASTISFENGNFSNVNGATQDFAIDYSKDAPNNTIAGWTASPSGNQILDCLILANSSNSNLCGTNAFGGGLSFSQFPGNPPVSGNYVALDGDNGYASPLQQVVTGLTIGTEYVLTFYQAAAQQTNYTGASDDNFQVTFGTQTFDSAMMDDASKGDVGWEQQTMTFTATATQQTLSFLAQGSAGVPPFVLLAGVTLVDPPSVPEPQTFALVGLGLLGVPLLRRPRKKRS